MTDRAQGSRRSVRRSLAARDASLATLLTVVALGVSLAGAAPRAQSRLTVIISDLHMGPGRDLATGQWLAVEDFRWVEDFTAFLAAVDEAGGGAADLVLNGDTFELWQPAGEDCRYPSADLGCAEPDALARLDRVLAAHAAEMAALGAFARAGANRVVLVPGDHDAALLFPSVAGRALAALDAPGRVEVASSRYWLSADGAVYAEHGHQIVGDPYRGGLPHAAAGRAHLQRTFGERFVQDLYNTHEPRYPVLDNFAQDGAGLKYLVAADPTIVATDPTRVDSFLGIFLQPTWQQFRLDLDGGDVEPPSWDLDAVREAGAAFFVESLVPDDRFRTAADGALAAGRLTLDPRESSDAELTSLCDYRAALRRARRRLERSLTQVPRIGPPVSECPRLPGTRGSAFEYFWRSRDAAASGHLSFVRRGLGTDGPPDDRVRVFVRGHTHLPDAGFVADRGASWPLVLNSGAWQRTLTPFQADGVMEGRGWSEADLLERFQPEDLPGCYGVVWIEPYTEDPGPEFRFWRSDGSWGRLPRDAASLEAACGGGGPAAR